MAELLNVLQKSNGLGVQYTKESINPFYGHFSKDLSKSKIADDENEEEYEPSLYEIDEIEKRLDSDFIPDDV